MVEHVHPTVHWREGMFLRPQHLQAFARQVTARIALGDGIGRPAPIGVVRIEIDEDALAQDMLQVVGAELALADGTLAVVPDNAGVEPREFGELFDGDSLLVHLGVSSTVPNTSVVGNGTDSTTRFRVETRDVFDENERDSTKPIEFRKLQAHLFFGDENREGYDCLPIALIVREGRPVAESVLSRDYIPPVLTCGASPVLMRILDKSVQILRREARDLAVSVPSMKSLRFTEKGADVSAIMKLQAVNTALGPLAQVLQQPFLHPHQAYLVMAQAVGSLAIFGTERTVPELPAFDTDQLGECFREAFGWIQKLAPAQISEPYDSEPFQPDPMQPGKYTVELDERWLLESTTCFLGVEVAVEPHQVGELVANGIKLVSPTDVEKVLKRVVPGSGLTYQRRPPVSFPHRDTLHYFLIEKEGTSREGWVNIQKERKAVVLSTLSALGHEVTFHLYVEIPES